MPEQTGRQTLIPQAGEQLRLLINPSLFIDRPELRAWQGKEQWSRDETNTFFREFLHRATGSVPFRNKTLAGIIADISRLTRAGQRQVYVWDEMTKLSEMHFIQSHAVLARPMVDLCCGYGYWISKTLQQIDVGIDIFPATGRFSRNISGFHENNFVNNTYQTVLQHDVTQKLPLPDQSVGTVTAICSLEHIQNYHGALEEIRRILKPDGKLIMTVDAPLLTEVLEEVFNEKYCKEFKREHQLETLLSLEQWKEALHQCGFQIDCATGYIDRLKTFLCLMTYFPTDFTSYWTQLGFSKLYNANESARTLWNDTILPHLTTPTNPRESMLIALSATPEKS